MINPDTTLADAELAARASQDAIPGSTGEANAAARAIQDFLKLDEHLRGGGAPPSAWQTQPMGALAHKITTEKDAEIARLKAELAENQGRSVLYAMEAQCLKIVTGQSPHGSETEVTLHATDTGHEWRLSAGIWQPVPLAEVQA